MAKFSKKSFLEARIKTMLKKDMSPLLKQARESYKRQASIFSRNPETYSHAYALMEEWYKDKGRKPASRMTKTELQAELYRLQEFFGSKSSTLKGTRELQRDAEKRIFGVDSAGRVKFHMTKNEAANFWANYHAFKDLDESFVRNMTSDLVQSVLGEWLKGTYKSMRASNYDVDPSRIMNTLFFEELREKIQNEYDSLDASRGLVDEERNLLSGRGPDL